MSHSHTNLLFHLVFSTKNRQPWLVDEVRPRVFQHLGGAVRGEKGIAITVGGMPDHVHIFAKLRQDRAVSDVLRAIKANSSGWIHRTFPTISDFAWQTGYGAFSVSFSQSERVKGYIQNQEEHHKTASFQEEYVALLRAHEVEYDERYIWA